MVSTSDGRAAEPDGMFSAIAAYVVTWTGRPSRAIASVAPITAAAPAMSDFMLIMPLAVFSERPPESKVMPLPTKARWVTGFFGV